MSTIARRNVAGFSIPDTPLVDIALEYAQQESEPFLFHHLVRCWLFAEAMGQRRRLTYDAEVVAVSTLLRGLSLADRLAGHRRFEVEAADRARAFSIAEGLGATRADRVWDCVALSSTPSIALFKETEVALCASAVQFDLTGLPAGALSAADARNITDSYPRLDFKEQLSRRFRHIAEVRPETTYDNFLREFGERFVAGYKPPSMVDLIASASVPPR